ncbi:MAG: hypothetical protein IH874_05315 [Candidatus Dadabacteria bacterium]|nr:hypothetical protein [Candidatus Dadabacteria bacterium]
MRKWFFTIVAALILTAGFGAFPTMDAIAGADCKTSRDTSVKDGTCGCGTVDGKVKCECCKNGEFKEVNPDDVPDDVEVPEPKDNESNDELQ